ncbi:unnamed protein product, partial [Timema podura]|nr:unnamed protein product [Timema podura]
SMKRSRLQTRQWSERVVRSTVRQGWSVHSGRVDREVTMMVTPKVLEEVRRHFNCPVLEGAELEDQGEEGTALTHWEKRVFENEAMTGTHTQNPVYSRITLALMEDTGWYKANYSMAQPLDWGRNYGCDFAMKSCKEWMDNRTASGESIHPFCNKVKRDPLETECTIDRSSVALCNLVEHQEKLPLLYQNFVSIPHVPPGKESYYGGSVTLADYCPYIQEFTWRSNNIVVRGSHCQYLENNPSPEKNFALENYNPTSRCFDHTDHMWEERSCGQVRQWRHWGSGCYQFYCQEGRLHVVVGELQLLRKGALVCPCEDLCHVSYNSFEKVPWCALLVDVSGESGDSKQGLCVGNSEMPPYIEYHLDELTCRAAGSYAPWTLLIVSVIGFLR